MKPSLLHATGLAFLSIVCWIVPVRALQSGHEQEPRPDERARSGKPGILCLLTPYQYRQRGWMLAAEGGLLQDERLAVRSAWKGDVLEVEYSGVERGVWGNTLRLTFRLADPIQPAVEAEFSWFTDVGPRSATVRELTGEVFVVPLDVDGDPWARVKQGWTGRTQVQIGFELHGRDRGDPLCLHGVFDLEPGAPQEK